MNKTDINRLKYLKIRKEDYGYHSIQERCEFIRLKSLLKIHKLKHSNKVLSSKRKSIENSILKTHVIDALSMYLIEVNLRYINKLSEKIGKNSAKIQRLRTQYRQLKPKSSAADCDEVIDDKVINFIERKDYES